MRTNFKHNVEIRYALQDTIIGGKEMLLQEILFPSKEICLEKELYFRYSKDHCLQHSDIAQYQAEIKAKKEEAERIALEKERLALLEEQRLARMEQLRIAREEAMKIAIESGITFDPSAFEFKEELEEELLEEPEENAASAEDAENENAEDENAEASEETEDAEPEEIPEPETGIIFKKKNALLKFDTYFNAFSIAKWRKYTNLSNLGIKLVLQGTFKINVKHVSRMAGEQTVTMLRTYMVEEPEKKRRAFEIPMEDFKDGLLYIEIIALEEHSVFYNGFYYTEVADQIDDLNPVKFAIDICTFRREEYVTANIHKLLKMIIRNPESPLHGRLDVYVSDNGRTLDYEALNSEHVHVFPNKNLGGAGGFGRSMYESMLQKTKKGYTHIIMMDDDIRLDPHVLERNYAFLRLLKSDYSDAFIGGAMLRLDMEWMQSESGDLWNVVSCKPVKYKYDLRRIMWILKNEKEDTVNHFGWWYCCMPIAVVQPDNLPLPIFIKRDDIEYGLRNGRHFININGLCVWHEAFEGKRVPYLDYYYYRNQSIMNARHRPHFGSEQMLNYFDTTFKKKIQEDIELYRYKEAHLKLQGIDDFLKGIDWLKAQDGELLNTITMRRRTYQKKPVEQLNCTFTHGIYENTLKFKETKDQEKKRIASHNGWDKPATKDLVIAPLNFPHPGMICGAKRVLYYDEASNTGYYVTRSENERDDVLKHFNMTRQNIIDTYDQVREEYDDRYEELLCREFWEKYLFTPVEEAQPIPLEWWEKTAHFTPARVEKGKEKLAEIEAELKRQKKLKVAIKSNRVVFYLTNRRGVTCNLKYILLELRKQVGSKLDIIWASDYPETCDSIRKMGIPVVKAGSEEHLAYHMSAKVLITNDNQPAHFGKRKGQIYINTWHAAMNYKTIGPDYLAPRTPEEMQVYMLENPQPDYYLSGSQFFTDDTSKSFYYDKKVFVPTGMARNDIFFTDYSEVVKKVRKECGVPDGKKIALYAPTFRRGFKIGDMLFDFRRFKAALSKRFGGEWVVLYRGHYFVKNNPKTDSIDVSRYEDMQELMCAADILVSDYSSCLWDFTFTGRPAIVFANDLDEYLYDDRGFALPLHKWPYPITRNTKQLVDCILNFDEKEYNEKVKLHHEREGAFEKGTSAKAAVEIIRRECGV